MFVIWTASDIIIQNMLCYGPVICKKLPYVVNWHYVGYQIRLLRRKKSKYRNTWLNLSEKNSEETYFDAQRIHKKWYHTHIHIWQHLFVKYHRIVGEDVYAKYYIRYAQQLLYIPTIDAPTLHTLLYSTYSTLHTRTT